MKRASSIGARGTRSLATTLGETERAEKRAALRHLLRHPLTTSARDPDPFIAIVRHRSWLVRWFADHTGWILSVDPAAGFARLHKVAARKDGTRPAQRTGKPPFDRRRYTLLCLILAALEDAASQTTLALLPETVHELSVEDSEIPPFEPERIAERRAFVEALRWLIEAGALAVRDGDTDRYARTQEANALYDVDDRLLRQLLASPVPPALAGGPGWLLEEGHHYPETEDGGRLRARHRVMRRLLDDPVVYYADLDDRAFEWLDHSRGFVYRLLEDELGLPVERRREGLAAIDPEGELTDTAFPAGDGTVKHAALLLADKLGQRARAEQGVCTREEVAELVEALAADYGERCGWSRAYLEDGGAGALAEDAVAMLEKFALVQVEGEHITPRPAIARFLPAPPERRTP